MHIRRYDWQLRSPPQRHSAYFTAKPPGFGIRCMHLILEICRCAGIHDLAARVGRSRNPINTVKATFEALTSQKLKYA